MLGNSKGSFVIPVSNGIFAHRSRIGASIWVFLWLIDRSTDEVPTTDGEDVEGLVLGGKPIMAALIGAEIGETARAVREHLDNLADHGYVRRIDHGAGKAFGYAVRKSKKFRNTRAVILPDPLRKNVRDPYIKTSGTPTEKGEGPIRFSAAHNKEIDNTNRTQQLNPQECAVAVAKEHGISSRVTIEAIEKQITLELGRSTETPQEIADQINHALRKYTEAKAKLKFHWGPQRFLEDGHWRNPEGWPWKESTGAIPGYNPPLKSSLVGAKLQ